MIIEKVTIHNIASIEDAVVDFTAEPLASSDVFLIAGKTGAGKSTILDAISLALYDNIPRFKHLSEQNSRIADGDTTITAKDTRQLLRRGTHEGFVELLFTGNNGIHYKSTWSVARANKNPAGRLQQKKWVLWNLSNGAIIDGDKAIEKEINAATGDLEFNQFCRTTMLAQGEFLKFLNSKNTEKSEILEKITDTGIYSEIGKKFFELTNEKKKELDDANRLLEQVKPPTEAEIERKREKLKSLTEEQGQIEGQNELLELKKKWIEKEQELASQIDAAQKKLNGAKLKAESEESREQAALVKEWNDTIDARQQLKRWADANKELNRIADERKGLCSDYGKAAAGLGTMRELLQKCEVEKAANDAFLESQKSRKTVYEQKELLLSLLGSIEDDEKKKRDKEKEIEELNKQLDGPLKLQAEQAAKELEEADKAAKDKEEELEGKEKELMAANLEELRKQQTSAVKTLADIEMAQSRLKVFLEEKERVDKERSDLEQLKKDYDELEGNLEGMKAAVDDSEKLCEERRKTLEKMNDSVGDWAKVARAKLQKGDLCPVCRQKVEQPLHVEEELKVLVDEAKEQYEAAYGVFKDNEKKYNEDKADAVAKLKDYERRCKLLNDDKSLGNKHEELLCSCRLLGIAEQNHEVLEPLFDEKHKESEAGLGELGKRLDDGRKIEEAVEKLRKEFKEANSEKDKAKTGNDEAEKALRQCKNDIDTADKLKGQLIESIKNSRGRVDNILAGTLWDNDWRGASDQFKAELITAARKYNDTTERQTKLTTRIDNLTKDSGSIADTLDNVKRQLGDNITIAEGLEGTPQNELLKAANELLKQTAALQSRQNAAQQQKNDSWEWLNDFHKANPTISSERLQQLSTIAQDKIRDLAKENDEKQKAVTESLAVLNGLVKNKTSHQESKPQLTDDDLDGRLAERIEENKVKIKELSSAFGRIVADLEADDKNREKHASLIADRDAKQKVYERWDAMCKVFGDKEGNKLCTIAQSYVLSNLIHSANHYMRQLSDRYELTVEPGSFTIQVLDAYQGYESRSYGTISGGEGFLVSLALALALSDVGSHLSANILFIDEGFGTLSGEPLQKAINTLRALHSQTGRHVGIISHIEELQECIPVQIRVVQEARNAKSTVTIGEL